MRKDECARRPDRGRHVAGVDLPPPSESDADLDAVCPWHPIETAFPNVPNIPPPLLRVVHRGRVGDTREAGRKTAVGDRSDRPVSVLCASINATRRWLRGWIPWMRVNVHEVEHDEDEHEVENDVDA